MKNARLTTWASCTIGFVALVTSSVSGCSEVASCAQAVETEESEPQPYLPAFEPVLEECPHEDLDIVEWIGLADGLIFGEVVDIAPMKDVGWRQDVESGTSRVAEGEECDEIVGGFSIKLQNLQGYLHDADVPEEMEMVFGHGYGDMFLVEHMPTVEDEMVSWPDDKRKIEEGMVIGGLAFYNQMLDRWTFQQKFNQPIFQIRTEEGLIFQEITDLSFVCLPPPKDQLRGVDADELISMIEKKEADLFVEQDERRLTTPVEEEEDFGVVGWSRWMGLCRTGDEVMETKEIECQTQRDCEFGEACVEGDCKALDETP